MRKELLANIDRVLRTDMATDPRVIQYGLVPWKLDAQAKLFFYQGEIEYKNGAPVYTKTEPRMPVVNPYYANHSMWCAVDSEPSTMLARGETQAPCGSRARGQDLAPLEGRQVRARRPHPRRDPAAAGQDDGSRLSLQVLQL